jgi:hypothetical protein
VLARRMEAGRAQRHVTRGNNHTFITAIEVIEHY